MVRLRPYQESDYAKLVEWYESTSRLGQLWLFCSYGKTVLSAKVISDFSPQKTLCFVPSLDLVKQTAERIKSISKIRCIAIASDAAATKSSGMLSFKKALHEIQSSKGPFVVVLTYQMAKSDNLKKIEAIVDSIGSVDLAIFDEAHHLFGKNEKKSLKMFEYIKQYSKKCLSMTATPLIYDVDHGVAEAKSKKLFGAVLADRRMSDAIHSGLLRKPKVQRSIVNSFSAEDISGEVVRLLGQRRKKIIVFLDSIRTASSVQHVLTSKGIDYAYLITSDQRLLKRRQKWVVEAKHRDRAVLLTVHALAEGFDDPMLDSCMYFTNIVTARFAVQSIGRILRQPVEGKSKPDPLAIAYCIKGDVNSEINAKALESLLKRSIEESPRNGYLASVSSSSPLKRLSTFFGVDFSAMNEDEKKVALEIAAMFIPDLQERSQKFIDKARSRYLTAALPIAVAAGIERDLVSARYLDEFAVNNIDIISDTIAKIDRREIAKRLARTSGSKTRKELLRIAMIAAEKWTESPKAFVELSRNLRAFKRPRK